MKRVFLMFRKDQLRYFECAAHNLWGEPSICRAENGEVSRSRTISYIFKGLHTAYGHLRHIPLSDSKGTQVIHLCCQGCGPLPVRAQCCAMQAI